MKIAPLLGEEVDNPKVTFRGTETVLEERIGILSKILYDFIKEYDKDKNYFDNLDQKVNIDIDTVENEYFYDIKKKITTLHEGLDDLEAYNLLLQKQITTLKKEKVDFILQISALNEKLDRLEKDLGINIAAKRTKKKN